jgi:hypothetical protein
MVTNDALDANAAVHDVVVVRRSHDAAVIGRPRSQQSGEAESVEDR